MHTYVTAFDNIYTPFFFHLSTFKYVKSCQAESAALINACLVLKNKIQVWRHEEE